MKYFVKEYEQRYFAGIEVPNGIKPNTDDYKNIPKAWDDFFNNVNVKIDNKIDPEHFIGLEIYPFDFMETGVFDYYVLAETNSLFAETEDIVTKKLKKGRYICFPINFDDISNEIQKVYKYIEKENIKVHMGFDYEDYLVGEDYGDSGAVLNFCLLLEDDNK
jgi:predicted transcriptional regulator YdeE